jgi:hypothetical protein
MANKEIASFYFAMLRSHALMYRQLSAAISDQAILESIKILSAQLQAEKTALHPKSP